MVAIFWAINYGNAFICLAIGKGLNDENWI